MSIIEDSINQNIGNSDVMNRASVMDGNINYTGEAAKMFALQESYTYIPTSAMKGDGLDNWDIAQSHFFTVQISQLLDRNGKMFQFASGQGTYKDYVPIKSMNLTYTSYENMSVPFNIFGNLPLLHRKSVSTISFSCYDIDQDVIEMALRAWENRCFPEGRYVAYLDDIKATFKYRSYDVTGKMNFEKDFLVIPASSVSVSRSYEENGAKMLNFSLAVVGLSGNAVNGNKGLKIAELGYGDGYERADLLYEKPAYITGYQTNY